MAKHKWIQEAECDSCKGTGLYKGMGEHGGMAVVCHTCKGTGKMTIEITWSDFEGKKKRKDVTKVLQINPGIGTSDKPGYNFGGIPYADWFAGKPFPKGSEMREYTCPSWWFQSADYDKKPDWDECLYCGTFSDCNSFKTKSKCWERYDKFGKRGK